MIDPSICFHNVRFVSDDFISSWNSLELNISHILTMVGFGFGSWIPTVSVPGIGAIILRDFDFNDNLISFANHSILDIAIPASGLILICTIDGHKSNHSILIATLNSNSLFCRDLAFSIKNLSSIVVEVHKFDFSKDMSNVGLSHENLIIGFGFLSNSFCSVCCFIMLLIKERDTSCGFCTPKSCLVSFIFFAIASVFCFAVLTDLEDDFDDDLFLYFSSLTFIFGKEKLKVYNIHATEAINKITTKDLIAVACPQNIALNNSISGQDIYPQNCWYLDVSQSMIGKLIIPDTNIITTRNCLIIRFIKYHFDIINTHTSIDNPKNIFSHISPKITLA